MMTGLILQLMCLAAVMALLVRMAIGDLRAFIIPNRLNAAIAVVALVYIAACTPLSQLPDVLLWRGVQLLAVFALFGGLFALGWMGGGDVKLMAALALLFPLPELAQVLIYSSIAGGLLGLIAAIARKRRQAMVNGAETAASSEIPYGIAIAFGAMIPASQLFIKTSMTVLAA